ncbi:MAG: hypothetical protein PF692_13895 [Kiritimatiellae bacterium]|jgi:hypothetical protein|nr:hypothetical protein [Kiritimatiellia bacterium]
MITFLKLIIVIGTWIGSIALSDKLEINYLVAPGMILIGGISFFFGPEATGSGFFVRGGNFVNTSTPEWIWRTFGIILWIAATVTMIYMWKTKGI